MLSGQPQADRVKVVGEVDTLSTAQPTQRIKAQIGYNMYDEIEYKYKADNVSIKQFTRAMEDLRDVLGVYTSPETRRIIPTGYQSAGSWDIYYTNDEATSQFVRLRLDPVKPELTKKLKTTPHNSWHRIEVDLQLAPIVDGDIECVAHHVKKFLTLDGYKENFRIYKYCTIVYFAEVTFVHYCVFNDNMEKLGTFIEVEAHKNLSGARSILNTSVFEASAYLKSWGIEPTAPLKSSLFEMYKRG